MAIAERGYTHWTGTLGTGRRPWRVIAGQAIRLAWKRKFFKPILFFSLIPALVFAGGIYVSERLQDFQKILKGADKFLKIDPTYFQAYYGSSFLLFMMLVIMVGSGAGLIADDLRHNALPLYFSRPLRKRDYIGGKFAALAFFLLILTLAPGILFLLLKLIFSGSFKILADYPWLPFSFVGWSVFISSFFSLYTLLLSSLSRNRRYASILMLAAYFLSDVFFGIFYGIFHEPAFCLVSLRWNLTQLSAAFIGAKPRFDVPWIYSFLVLSGVMVAAVLVLRRKIRGAEVIR
jgi:ABC-type transport system involved in multi-copper enzyme maturation permease subunit